MSQRLSLRPRARPVRRSRPSNALAVAVLGTLGLLIVVLGVGLVLTRGGDGAGPNPTAAARAAAPATPAPVASPPPVACGERCLVRLADEPATRDRLATLGVRPSYARDGVLWAPVPASALPALAETGPATVVADAEESLHLHVMRIPAGGDPAPVLAAGQVLDRAGDQYIVRVPTVPFLASELTDRGIAVEKLPPAAPAVAGDRAALPPVEDLGAVVGAVSVENLRGTIAALEGMGAEDGGLGSRYYAAPGNVMAAEYIFGRLADLGLEAWYEDFVTSDGLLALNVVGEIPGRDPSKVYLVLGHFDSTTDGGPVAPGADDNASGIAAMLEIARILSAYQPRHPVRFLATNVEEVGIQGAPVFAARAAAEGVPIAGAFNVDAVGSAANGSLLILNADEGSMWLEDVLVEVNDRFGLGQELRVRQNPAIVADDNFLRDQGIPTVLLAREVYGWSAIHHTPEDVLATVDLENVRAATQLVGVAVATLVEG